MKKYLFVIAIFALYFSAKSQNVGIGTRDPKAALDVSSTTNGFLPPRLTIAQRDSIINPAQGLVIFCTDCDELEVFSGIQWKNIGGSAACIETTLPNIKICNQVWMPTNLATSNYRNGDPIPQVTDPIIWSNINIGAWCWYNNDSATYAKAFGKLYNWYAVNDPRGLAPNGWHIPSDQEYIDLSNCLGGDTLSGGKLKESSLKYWLAPNTGATNSSGFIGLPGGSRFASNGNFLNLGYYSFFWSSTEYNTTAARSRYLGNNDKNFVPSIYIKGQAFSVRCIKD